MDRTTELLSSYATSLRYSDLPPETIHEAKRRIIDALGCAMGGCLSEPGGIAQRLAAMTSSTMPSRVLASGVRTSPEMAAFANTTMVRYLDCNDTFVSAGSGHPSDMIPAALAVADPCRASGEDVIAATVLAYEVYGSFADRVAAGDRGWDQGIFAVIGSACAAGKILGLSMDQMSHAVSLAIVPNLPLNQTRVGELSMWKGCATAAAVRNGVFAALLAREGMGGPAEPFEGRHGLYAHAIEAMEPGPLDVKGPFRINDTSLKFFPSQIHTQGPTSLALRLRSRVDLDDVESINLETYRVAWASAGSEPEKWDPQARETADHSLPYLIAMALRDGAITPDSFAMERVRDPDLRPLMRKINIRENPEFTRRHPPAQMARLEVVTKSGERFSDECSYPKGHRENPLTDVELEKKFHGLARDVLSQEQRRRALDTLWLLEDVEDMGLVLDLFRVDSLASLSGRA